MGSEENEPQIKAPRVTPLEGVSTSTVAPVEVAHTYSSPPYVDIAALGSGFLPSAVLISVRKLALIHSQVPLRRQRRK